MKYIYQQFKDLLPDLNWTIGELAEKLSLAGHETEISDKDQLDVTLTANRKDCQDLRYLVFDVAGVYGLKTIPDIIFFKMGKPISVTTAQINDLLGSKIEHAQLKELERLGFEVTENSVTPPDFRDVETVADVAEEVVRQIGYDTLILETLQKRSAPTSDDYGHLLAVKNALVAIGLTETATNSFADVGSLEIKDPFSRDEPYLRPNLLVGLLKTLARNPYLKRAAFFEVGCVFTPGEVTKLALIVAGYKDRGAWQDRISQVLNRKIELAEIEPLDLSKFDVKQSRVGYVELPIENIAPTHPTQARSLELSLPVFKPISKFPPLVRDITFHQESNASKTQLEELKDSPDLLLIEQIDQYQDRLTYRLIWQKMSGTYSQEEISQIDEKLRHFQER